MQFESQTIPHFLSDQELETIERVVEQNRTEVNTYYDTTHSSGHNAVTYGFFLWMETYKEIREILLPKLQARFSNNLQLDTTHILNAYVPYGIHTDVISGGFDPDGPSHAAWTFIIPLEDYNSNTVVFKQGHETIKTVDKWVQAVGPEMHEINDQFHQKYLTHTDRLDLRYLTPEAVFPWKKGSLFAADRRKFHTSDDFPAHGIQCKRAIVIWSTIPKS
jgi:hypothetical protein